MNSLTVPPCRVDEAWSLLYTTMIDDRRLLRLSADAMLSPAPPSSHLLNRLTAVWHLRVRSSRNVLFLLLLRIKRKSRCSVVVENAAALAMNLV